MSANLLIVIFLAVCMGFSSCGQSPTASDSVKETENNADTEAISPDDMAVDLAIYDVRYQMPDSMVVHKTSEILSDKGDRTLSIQDFAILYNYYVFVRVYNNEGTKEQTKGAFLNKYLSSNRFYHSFIKYVQTLHEQSRTLLYQSIGAVLLNKRHTSICGKGNDLQPSEQDTTPVYKELKSILYNISDSMIIRKTASILLDNEIHHLSTSEFATIYAYYLIGGIDEAASEAISDYVCDKIHGDLSFTTSFIEHAQALKKKNKDELYRNIITDLAFSRYANSTIGEYADNLRSPEIIKAFLKTVSIPLYSELVLPEYKQLLTSISATISADWPSTTINNP